MDIIILAKSPINVVVTSRHPFAPMQSIDAKNLKSETMI